MKHLLRSSLAVIMAVLLTFSSGVPVFAAEITKPINSLKIVETDDCQNSKYVESSSTLYIDQTTDDKNIYSADLQLVTDPEDTDDIINISASDYAGGANVKYEYNEENKTYTITASGNAATESYIDFSAESGTANAKKRINLKKCIPMTRFWLSYNGTKQVAGGSTDVPTINAFTKDNVVISVIEYNTTTNDVVKFSIWTDKECTIPADDITLNATDYKCELTNPSISTFYLKAEVASREDSGLARDLSCVLRITYNEFIAITNIGFTQNSYEMGTVVDNTLDLSKLINYSPDNKSEEIIYSSDNPSVAKVDKDTGKVTAVAGGTANITAEGSESGKTAVCKINVTPQISKLELQAEKKTLPLGSKMQINCIKTPADAIGEISWTSSNPEAVSVDENGLITVNESYVITELTNKVTITAKSDSNVSISIDINIEEPIRTTSIDITPTKVADAALKLVSSEENMYSIYRNDSITLNCTTSTENGVASNDVIVWKVSVNGAHEVPVEEAENYIKCQFAGNNLTIKTLTEDRLTFTAYSVLLGQLTSECSASDSIVICSNTKSTYVTLSAGNSIITTNSSVDITITSITPNVITNKDEVVFTSSNTDIAEVTYDPLTKTATVTSKDNIGQTVISCYVCYDKENYTDRALIKTLTVTVSTDIAEADVTGLENVPYRGSPYGISDFPDLALSYCGLVLVNGVDYTVTFSRENYQVGYTTVTFKGKGSYAGEKTVVYQIIPRDITDCAVVSDIPNQVYTGSEVTPTFSVRVDNMNLVLNTDYTVSYSDNIDTGTATVKITGTGNFCETVEKTFTIIPSGGLTIDNINPQTYTGNEVCPQPVVKFKDKVLTEGEDYELSYENNTNVGTGTVIVTGINNFAGEFRRNFSITPNNFSDDIEISVSTPVIYTGAATAPEVKVKWNGRVLTEGTEFTVAYKNNINVGTATAIVTGKGSFIGSATADYQISPKDISGCITLSEIADQVYSGVELTPVPVVKINNATLRYNVDFTTSYSENVNVGTAKVTVSGAGNYCGSVNANFNIVPAKTMNIANINPQVYTGEPVCPAPVVTFGQRILVAGVDYEVSYENNVNVGRASVIVKGKNNFTEAVKKDFNITACNFSEDVEISVSSPIVFTGAATAPGTEVKWHGRILTEGTDYIIAYANNVNVGTATVTIAGKGSFTGTKSASYQIVPKDISGSAAISSINEQVYNGKEITPGFTVAVDGKGLKLNQDITVSYANNVNAGTAAVIVNGTGNYCGTAYSSFTIKPSSAFGVANIAAQVYTGAAVCPAPTVSFGTNTLTYGTDYNVSYENNVNAGKATVVVTGKGNFAGEVRKDFMINQLDFTTTAEINVAANVKYTGKAVTPAVTVTNAGVKLTPGVDYDFAYKNNINIGTAVVVITGKGNFKGSASKEFQITPVPKGAKNVDGYWVNSKQSKTAIKKAKAGKKSIKVSWKKVSKITGYQIQYSTNKKFKKNSKYVEINKKATTSKTIKKLKSKKTYYVRIRTYKTVTVSGQKVKVYSNWSKVKAVKVK